MKFNVKRTILVGFAFLLITMFWQVYDNLIAKMLVDTFGLNQTWSGIVMALDNILAVIMLPIFGLISDRTSFKKGKRTPFIFVGTIVSSILIVIVSLFAYYQQVAVVDAGITPIIQLADGAGYQFSQGSKVFHELVKSDLAVVRSQLILDNITSTSPLMLILFIVALFFTLFAMSIFRTPAVSLMPDVTPKPLRSKANSIINLMGTIGGVLALALIFVVANEKTKLFEQFHFVPTFIVLALFMLAFLTIFMLTVKESLWTKEMQDFQIANNLVENEEKEVSVTTNKKRKFSMQKKYIPSFVLILTSVFLWFMAYNAATTKFSVYATNHLHFPGYSLALIVANATAAIAFIPIGIISTKIGRRKTILIGVILLTVAFILGIFARPESAVLMYFTMGLAGIAWATINVNSYPMVVEMSNTSDIGVYTGYYYSASMTAQIITPILSGIIMDSFGLDKLFIYSAVFSALAFIPMLFVKYGEPKKLDQVVEVKDE